MPSLNYHFSRMLTPYESLFSQKQGTPLTLQLLVPEDTTQVARSHDTSQYPQLMNTVQVLKHQTMAVSCIHSNMYRLVHVGCILIQVDLTNPNSLVPVAYRNCL